MGKGRENDTRRGNKRSEDLKVGSERHIVGGKGPGERYHAELGGGGKTA